MASNGQLDIEQIDEAVNALEFVKSTIDADNDEAIDKVDEIQDSLQYMIMIGTKEPPMEKIKTELTVIINDLQEWSK